MPPKQRQAHRSAPTWQGLPSSSREIEVSPSNSTAPPTLKGGIGNSQHLTGASSSSSRAHRFVFGLSLRPSAAPDTSFSTPLDSLDSKGTSSYLPLSSSASSAAVVTGELRRSSVPRMATGAVLTSMAVTESTSTPVMPPPRRMITRAYRKGISPIAQLRLLHTNSPDRPASGPNTDDHFDPSLGSLVPPPLSFKRPYRTRKMREAEEAKARGTAIPTKRKREEEDEEGRPRVQSRRSRSRLPSPVPVPDLGHRGTARRGTHGSSSSVSSSSGDEPSRHPPPPPRGGVLRCVCNAFLLSPKESLLECRHCRNYCHPSCVGVDHLEVRLRLREDSFVCPFCMTPIPSSTHPSTSLSSSSTLTFSMARIAKERRNTDSPPYSTDAQAANIKNEEGEENSKRKELLLNKEREGWDNGTRAPTSHYWSEAPSAGSPHLQSSTISSRITSFIKNDETKRDNTNTMSTVSAGVDTSVSSSSVDTCSLPPYAGGVLMHSLGQNVAPSSWSGEKQMSFSPAALPPVPRQAPQRLREVPDVFPSNIKVLFQALQKVQHIITKILHCSILELPHTPLTESQVEECMECCKLAVSEATLSATYPMYCLREVRTALHPYVQGTLLVSPVHPSGSLSAAGNSSSTPASPSTTVSSLAHLSSQEVGKGKEKESAVGKGHSVPPLLPPAERHIVSLIFTNGMDHYGNLKSIITQLKSAIQRGHITKAELNKRLKAVDERYPEDTSPPHLHHFVESCLGITDVSDFVHITLSATHPSYQGQRLATILFTLELLKWSIRGRRRAFLNMAIEKHVVRVGEEETLYNEDGEVRERNGPKSLPTGLKNPQTFACSSPSSPPPKTGNTTLPAHTPGAAYRIELLTPPASRRLYHRFGFREVYPRTDPKTGKPRFTSREADMGRVMVNFDIPTAALRAAAWLELQYMQGESQSTPEKGSYTRTTTSSGSGGSRVFLPVQKTPKGV